MVYHLKKKNIAKPGHRRRQHISKIFSSLIVIQEHTIVSKFKG